MKRFATTCDQTNFCHVLALIITDMNIVYKHVCQENGKTYVGATCNDACSDPQKLMMKRWSVHVRNARHGSPYAFHAAIRKYGVNAFEHVVLEICSTAQEAFTREVHWISIECSTADAHGYNMTIGGDRVVLLPELRAQHRDATKAAMARPDVQLRHLTSQRHPATRRAKSDSARQAWSDPAVRERHARARERQEPKFMIEQLERESLNIIATFKSCREASRATGAHRGCIAACIDGKIRHAGGFMWRKKS